MNGLLLGATSVLLGVLHGADPDHVVEMSDFVSQDPRTRRVVGFALKFGGGHTFTVLLAGLVVQLLKKAVPDVFSTWFEVVSGVLLVTLGLWAVRRTWLRVQGLPGLVSTRTTTTRMTPIPFRAWTSGYSPTVLF